MARKKFEKANPAIASARIAKEKAIKDAAEKKKAEEENIPEEEEVEVLEVFKTAVEGKDSEKKVGELMKKQHIKFRETLEKAKEAATDRMKTVQQRKAIKIQAIREQKKYMIMKN